MPEAEAIMASEELRGGDEVFFLKQQLMGFKHPERRCSGEAC